MRWDAIIVLYDRVSNITLGLNTLLTLNVSPCSSVLSSLQVSTVEIKLSRQASCQGSLTALRQIRDQARPRHWLRRGSCR